MTSYLRYLFTSSSDNLQNTQANLTSMTTNKSDVNTSIQSEYLGNVDINYDSIVLRIGDCNTCLTFMIDVLKSNHNKAIDILNDICDVLESNETQKINCSGDCRCFFRQEFYIEVEKDSNVAKLLSKEINRCGVNFSVLVDKTLLVRELRKMLTRLN